MRHTGGGEEIKHRTPATIMVENRCYKAARQKQSQEFGHGGSRRYFRIILPFALPQKLLLPKA